MASNIDTETVAENLVELLTNSVNMTSVYYDLFLNETPMDVTFKQYDDNNKLVDVTLPNRAKDRQICKSGTGSPENVVKGNVGECYVDTVAETVYFKVKNSGDTTGWILALTESSIAPILNNYVRTSRKINGKNLGSDITLSASDVGALPSTTKYGYSLGMTGTNLTLKDQSGNNLSTVVVSALGANQDLSNLSDTGNAKIVPSQSGQSGKYLTTDGTSTSWATVNSAEWGNITGTLSNQTDLSTALESKVDVSYLSEITPVVATYVDGTSGYRIWSDGYCEQWGHYLSGAVTSATVSFPTVSLPRMFANVNYNVVISPVIATDDTGGDGNDIAVLSGATDYGKTVSSFRVSTVSGASYSFMWRACGYLADSEL